MGLAARSPVVDNRTRRWYTLPVALPAAEMPRAVSRRLSPPILWEGERFFFPPVKGGDADGYISRAVSVLPCGNRHYRRDYFRHKKEVSRPFPNASAYF